MATKKKVVKKSTTNKKKPSKKPSTLADKRKLGTLTAHEMNPRKISASQQRILFKNLQAYGDLSGITFNRRNKKLVGGHQRFSWFSETDEVEVIHKFDKPQKDGTVLLGLVEHQGQKFFYREVSLDERKHKAAMVAANKAGGEWEWDGLKQLLVDLDTGAQDMELTGFEMTGLEDLLSNTFGNVEDSKKKMASFEYSEPGEKKNPEEKSAEMIECPNCGVMIDG